MRLSKHTRRAKQGFTLLELIIVVSILVILAGFVLGKLDILDMKANKGVAASNMGGVSRYIQMFRVNSTTYPDGWDSLTTTTGALWAAPAIGQKGLDPQLVGGPVSGSPTKLLAQTIDLTAPANAGFLRSLTRMGIATTYTVNTAASVGNPGDAPGNDLASGTPTTRQPISITNNAFHYATLNAGAGGDEDAKNIVKHIYPQDNAGVDTTVSTNAAIIPGGHQLVVVGFGHLNACIGNSASALLNEAPFYANTNSTLYYNRFLCVFDVSTGGSRAKLVAVLGSDGDRLDEEIADFYEQE